MVTGKLRSYEAMWQSREGRFAKRVELSFLKNLHLRICLLILRDRGRERERERYWCERETPTVASGICPTKDQPHDPGLCPDWEMNPKPFGLWVNDPVNWATWPGLELSSEKTKEMGNILGFCSIPFPNFSSSLKPCCILTYRFYETLSF